MNAVKIAFPLAGEPAEELNLGFDWFGDETRVKSETVNEWLASFPVDELEEFAKNNLFYKNNCLLAYHQFLRDYTEENRNMPSFFNCFLKMMTVEDFFENCKETDIDLSAEAQRFFDYAGYLEHIYMQCDLVIAHGLKTLKDACKYHPEDSIILDVGLIDFV
jgi:hypothetical protein